MIRFSLDGVKHEFDDDHISNVEVAAIKKVTGYGYVEFWTAFSEVDNDAVTALVWIHRKRSGEPELRFSDVEFDFLEFISSMESDKVEETDAEADPPADADPDATPSI